MIDIRSVRLAFRDEMLTVPNMPGLKKWARANAEFNPPDPNGEPDELWVEEILIPDSNRQGSSGLDMTEGQYELRFHVPKGSGVDVPEGLVFAVAQHLEAPAEITSVSRGVTIVVRSAEQGIAIDTPPASGSDNSLWHYVPVVMRWWVSSPIKAS